MSQFTRILNAAQQGDPKAARDLLPPVYDELRRLAAQKMAHEAANTLQPTALVHEVWLRLTAKETPYEFQNRAHFFAAAAEAMRRILIENARRKARQKRGGQWEKVDLDQVQIAVDADPSTLLAIDQALEKLARASREGEVSPASILRRFDTDRSGPSSQSFRNNRQKALDLRPCLASRRTF